MQAHFLKPLAFALALATLSASAQAPGDIRVALVIGNSAYSGPAALVNPANDATAMSGTLRQLGFEVTELRDGTREQMAAAIDRVRAQLGGRQGVGMLYYAGHGVQLDWRNYMIPVDARLSSAADVPRQAVDIEAVIAAFRAAGNRMNIVVLDACRDNPFEGTASAKGLAQLDAPPGTFLAYATAPGNVAADGTGQSNGLYTGFLVQELGKPQAKIEDVFKRVRFSVRRASEGRQIPWESTSLEDDFYFNTGVRVARPDDKAREEAFAREKAEWDRIRDSRNADDFFEFLKKYPNGPISQAAQERLDRLAKAQVVATPAKGREEASLTRRVPQVGDTRTYEYRDWLTKVVMRRDVQTVTAVRDDIVEVNNGALLSTLSGAVIRNDAGISFDPPLVTAPTSLDDFQIGRKWVSRSQQSRKSDNLSGWVENAAKITAFEDVAVQAGTFKAYRIEIDIRTQTGLFGKTTMWLAPRVGVVKFERRARNGRGQDDSWTRELVSYRLAG